ncbi:eukaryotic translation initiation factor 5-like [Macadamia integrifolia]|uniref:eukaryotic translation initiation factor 5-like n=1 Tax=Macadamia integrifolia TaxID=60698 RepID=UPI001C4E70F4|nr:eukaryotic translation initiation factor 5-like [Macadamia integrifolia]XP_042508607.1 eukaryotic translation initiation factor 5-like [Macadamia integrifolia]
MALQNIGAANSDDAFYRYKMPKMITKIEGRGNGIKTNVVNMVDIAKALARPASYTTKYFGCELGAQSKFDEKTGISLVNGAHDTAKLAGLLENFIKKYVQCYGCGNPETEIVITKTQMITLKCAACGYVSDVDMRDKLTTFIIKNPPETKKGSKDKKAMRKAEKERLKEGQAADEEQKKLKKELKKKAPSKEAASKGTSTKKKGNASDEDRTSPTHSQADENEAANDNDDDDDDDDIQWQTDTSLEAARQRIQEQLSTVTAEMVMLTATEEKPKAKKIEVAGKNSTPEAESKSDHKGGENGTAIESTQERLVKEIRGSLKKGCTVSQLHSTLGSLSGTPQEVMNALFEALFEGVGKGFAKEVAKKKNYLTAAAAGDDGSQMHLLCALVNFCGKASSEVVKVVAVALKTLYDSDVLEEEIIVQWYQEGLAGGNKNSQVWKNVKPFIEWLQSAESESEEVIRDIAESNLRSYWIGIF